MAVSKKPIIWSLFAAGGTITAFLMPVAILSIALAVPLGWLSADTFSYASLQTSFASPITRLLLFGVLFLSVWHAAHRMRITVHDFGLRLDKIAASVFYSLAFIASLILIVALF